ncbi:acyl-CoA dehydrogenase [Rhodobacteraceae bacterium NNCM2]|nr:acyl-CoA dehydrogenase [Coraliihabitans acroporae]
MPSLLRRQDLDFLLYDVMGVEEIARHPRFAHSGRAEFDQILDLAEKVAEEHFLPHAAKLDANEPSFDRKQVTIIPEVRAALDVYTDAGFFAAPFDHADGGMQLPYAIHTAIAAWFVAANWSTSNYPAITSAAANLLAVHGSAEQKTRWLAPMMEGRFFGTMCLSEPDVGSSVGDIRMRAEPQEDGSYRLFGSKMWTSGGEHDLCENIVNLVLARIPGAPPGTRGISLFIVPRLVDGARNDIRVIGLNHKMGCRGTVNCALNFGENEGAVGWLVGEPHQGLSQMFTMMNEMRIGVGMCAATLGYTGYLHALEFAKERRQGRPVGAKDPTTPMVPIIRHADVKRMLLTQKTYVEGAMSLVLFAASLVDRQKTCDRETSRQAELLLDLLTPIVKSWPSEYGLRANDLAIQVLGGAGYTRDYPLERFYRDNRLNHIHEGTRGIQGRDLLGRKVPAENGAGLRALLDEINATAKESALEEAASLKEWSDLVGATTLEMLAKSADTGPEVLLANAVPYLDMLGHLIVGWLWVRQAEAAQVQLATASGERRDFLEGKLTACRFFFRYEMPVIAQQAALLRSMDDTTVTARVEIF